MQALFLRCLSRNQWLFYQLLPVSVQKGEKVKGSCLHEDCVLACSVASGSEFGLAADAEEKMEKKLFPRFYWSGFMLI